MLKLFIKLLISLFLILILAAIGLAVFVDPNRYKDFITTKVSAQIHHTFVINGNMSWRFLPRLGFTLEEVQIDNSTTIQEVHVYPSIMPLLQKQININEFTVENAQINLPNKTTLMITHLNTNLHMDMPNKQYEAHNGTVNMQLKNQAIDIQFDKLLADLNTDTLKVNKIVAKILNNTHVTGDINFNHISNMDSLKADGDFNIDTLTLSGLTFSQIQTHLNLNNKIITLSPFKSHLNASTLNGDIVLNMQQSTPHWNINATLNNMMIDGAKFTGHLNAKAKVSANGFDKQTFLNSLNGNASMNMNDGILHGTDLEYWLTVGESMLLSAKNITELAINTAQTAVSKPNTKQTAFKEISATFAIKQGIAHNDDLKIYNDKVSATGKGNINLPQQTLNYSVLVGRTNTNSAHIPLKITGNITQPEVSIDAAAIQKLLIKGAGNVLLDTMTGGVVPAIGAGEAIVNSITGSSSSNTNTNKNTDSKSDPIKDTLKGLFGQ